MAYTTINKSSEHFNTTLHTGNGSTQSITGVGFQSDLTWIKRRSADGWHWLTDAVRGTTKTIYSNESNAEETNTNGLTAFGTDGFTVGSNADINGNGQTHVGWNWKANGAGSANTDGSISSTVSANTTSGFSIVKYTGASNANGATIGHGLGAVPKMIIVKETSASGNNWVTYNSNLGAGKYMALNLTIADQSSSTMWYNSTPTSSVFSVANDSQTNGSGSTFIAYCFAEKKGFSKFGSYTGNGSTNGTFVYTGFKPAWVMIKNTSVADWWGIIDNKRVGYNPTNNPLFANTNGTEGNFNNDLLSNGFKIRSNTGGVGTSGNTYIYMAFAEAPLVGSNNVPCTAR